MQPALHFKVIHLVCIQSDFETPTLALWASPVCLSFVLFLHDDTAQTDRHNTPYARKDHSPAAYHLVAAVAIKARIF